MFINIVLVNAGFLHLSSHARDELNTGYRQARDGFDKPG